MQQSLFEYRGATMEYESQDITHFYHKGSPTSVEANKSIKHDKARLRTLILTFIKKQGSLGATCDEIEQALDLSHQTASARCTELLAQDQVKWLGDKRKTRSGRNARVLV